MTHKPRTIMSIAVHHNRIGFCFIIGRQPMDWQLSYKAARTFDDVRTQLAKWLEFYSPDIVITEQIQPCSRKGGRVKGLIEIIEKAVTEKGVKQVKIVRHQPYGNKYEQIESLCQRYPQMQAVAPKRRKYYEKEPPYVTLFEALAMAEQFLSKEPPSNLPQ